MPATALAQRAARLRAFNRLYTRKIGALHEHLLESGFSLPESRLLWELAHHDGISAAALARDLDLDPGYLSRLLRSLKERGLVEAERDPQDARQSLLKLTPQGREAFAPLNEKSQQASSALLARLAEPDQQQLMQALQTLEKLLAPPQEAETTAVVLRPHRAGDIGWIVSRHGALYAQEYGWDARFEALVAHIGARFLEHLDPAREACWIADRAGEPLGSVMLVQARDDETDEPLPGIAQLRLLLVEPGARGLGLGKRLVGQCTRFARQAGYRQLRLWTQSCLLAARRLYSAEGYRLVSSEPHHSFGHPLVAEHWEMDL